MQLDGLESEEEGSILFLASTNLPWSLDPAILRRFNKRILVDLPEEVRLAGLIHNEENGSILTHVSRKKGYRSCVAACGPRSPPRPR